MHKCIEFTRKERAFILILLDNWEESLEWAKKKTEEDHSLETAEDLLTLMEGYYEDQQHITTIREKIR